MALELASVQVMPILVGSPPPLGSSHLTQSLVLACRIELWASRLLPQDTAM